MPPDQRDAGYLLDMLQYARAIARSIEGRTRDDYLRHEDLRLAIERRLEIIGEAARRISETFREQHPKIPWQKIVAQRNLLVHQYGGIDDEILWSVATVSIPELVALLEPLVPDLSEQP